MPDHPVRLCFLLDQMIIGGVENVFLHLASYLSQDRQFSIRLITGIPIADSVLIDQIKAHNIHYLTLRMRRMPRRRMIRFFFRLGRKLFRPLTTYRLIRMTRNQDIIIDFKNGFFHHSLKKISAKPRVLWLHGSAEYTMKDLNFDWSFYDRIVCLTDTALTKLQLWRPEIAHKMLRIYNPVDVQKIRQLAQTRPEHSDRLDNLPEHFFISVARLNRDKDIETIISAFLLFCSQNPDQDYELLLVGDGPDRFNLQNRARSTPFAARIHFLGSLSPAYYWIQKAEALILSSHNEGFGLVLLEGIVLNTLVISSDCPSGPREILDGGKYGLLFPPGDAQKLSETMREVAAGSRRTFRIKQHMRERVVAFDSSVVTSQVKALFSGLTERIVHPPIAP